MSIPMLIPQDSRSDLTGVIKKFDITRLGIVIRTTESNGFFPNLLKKSIILFLLTNWKANISKEMNITP